MQLVIGDCRAPPAVHAIVLRLAQDNVHWMGVGHTLQVLLAMCFGATVDTSGMMQPWMTSVVHTVEHPGYVERSGEALCCGFAAC